MGLSHLVYPGAHHTRFHHALGCMHLMTKAIEALRMKGVEIEPEEENGLLCAILLHDIGHGPFSHALEGILVQGRSHEKLSLDFMQALNGEFTGQLDLALSIFKGKYKKPFMNQLVSSQLDMDRLDYLKRDSFYSGVTEGNINSERLISMLHVVDGQLVVEEKGIYAVEKFLMARRFMYWQVYLHKTGLVAEQLMIRVIQRAKLLLGRGESLSASRSLLYFLEGRDESHPGECLETFAQLDDVDILAAIKSWQFHSDFVLSKMCRMLLQRNLLHIKMKKRPVDPQKLKEKLDEIAQKHELSIEEASNFVFSGTIANKVYSEEQQPINILKNNGKIVDVLKESDQLSLKALSSSAIKYYSCYPKEAV